MRKGVLVNIDLYVSFIGVVALLYVTVNGFDYSRYIGNKQNAVIQDKLITNLEPMKKTNEELYAERMYLATMMHELANGLIVAKDNKIGDVKPMTQQNIDEARTYAKTMQDSAELQKLASILEDWKKGNFSHIVADHNMVWAMLDGEAGRAIAINNDAVVKAKENLK